MQSKQCGNAEWTVRQKPQKIQPSIAEIDNMHDIWQLSSHYITVLIAFSHSRVHSTSSVTATAALQQSSVTTPRYYRECYPNPRNYRSVCHKISPITAVLP